jgi:signal-transduction protein with cAMP-binding, CBS, and nucleotidyltransferase domain
MMKIKFYMPGDLIIDADSCQREMYIILEGQVSIVNAATG